LLDTRIEIAKPSINISKITTSTAIPEERYVVLFIGASDLSRKWSSKYFAEVAKYICEKYGLRIIICGAEEDRDDAIRIKELVSDLRLTT